MNVNEIIDGIIEKKKAMNMTNQQIADASGVPKSTVDRILRKDPASPSLQNVLDIAGAVGYQFFEKSPLPPISADSTQFADYLVALYDDRIARMNARHNRETAELRRWNLIYFFLFLAMVIFTFAMLIIDVLHPDIGWIREQLGLVWKAFSQT